MDIILLFISGLLVGVLGAFLGVSGGVVIVPILTLALGYTIHDAIAVSLIVVVANSIAISPSYLKAGISNLRVGLSLALASAIGALIGGVVSVNLPQRVLYVMLGIVQLIVGVIMWRKGGSEKGAKITKPQGGIFDGSYYDESEQKTVCYGVKSLPHTFGVSGCSGVLSGLLGVGGGVFLVPAMNIIAGMPIKAAAATSTLVVGFTAAAGGAIYFISGYLKADAAVGMILGLYVSTKFAVKLFGRVKSSRINQMFVILMFIVALQMLYKGIK